jgi:hypothetical protein
VKGGEERGYENEERGEGEGRLRRKKVREVGEERRVKDYVRRVIPTARVMFDAPCCS